MNVRVFGRALMTASNPQHAILAGVDGSTSAKQAVHWAVKEALRRRVPLRLLHACAAIPTYSTTVLPQSFYDALKEQGQQWLREAADLAGEAAPEVEVSTELLPGYAADVVINQSSSAGLVVLGSRGLGGFTGLLVGSVAVAVAAHGHCPVVVVRGAIAEAEPPEQGPVVVGVDGSPASEAAIGFAFDAASRRGVPLIAVHTWSDLTVDTMWMAAQPSLDWDTLSSRTSTGCSPSAWPDGGKSTRMFLWSGWSPRPSPLVACWTGPRTRS